MIQGQDLLVREIQEAPGGDVEDGLPWFRVQGAAEGVTGVGLGDPIFMAL